MAMRIATMSSMSSRNNPPFARESDHFMRKLVILLLLIIATALGIVLLFRDDRDLPLLLSTFFADASIGLIAGFGSRIVFRKWNSFIRYLTATGMAILGMTVLGFLTHWVLGIGPIGLQHEVALQIREIRLDGNLLNQLREMKIDPRTFLEFDKMGPSDAAHLAASLLLTGLSLLAWRQTTITQSIEVVPLYLPQGEVRPSIREMASSSSGSSGHARIQLPGSWFLRSRPDSMPRARIGSRNRIRKMARNDAKPARRNRFMRKPHVQLALVEEHRCPYCLDLVTHGDPRGVKECEVCNTLHHGDCWAITGVCQVPHLNT